MALVTTQSKPFMQLVDLQQKSLNTLNDIKDSVGKTADAKVSLVQADQLEQLKKILDVQKDALALNKKAVDKKEMSEISKSMKNWKTWGDKIRDMTRAASEAINPTNISKKLFGAFNVGGIFNKKIAALDYIQTRKAVGDTGKDVGKRGKQYADSLYRGLRAQDQLDKMRASGASDEDIKSTKKGRATLRAVSKTERELGTLSTGVSLDKSSQDASNKMGGNVAGRSVPLPKTPSDKGKVPQSTTDVLADQQSSREAQLEATRQLQLQTDLLTQIANNTSALKPNGGSAAGGAEDKSKTGGALDGVGKSIKGIGSSIGALGKGVGAGIGGLIGGIFTGIMKGIADGIAAFGSGKTLKGVAVLGVLAGVVYGFSQALSSFQNLDWKKISGGLVVVAAITAAAGGLGLAADKFFAGALAFGAIGAALWVFGKALDAVGDAFNNFIDGIERLSKIGFDSLAGVAGGITLLAGAIAAFGAGAAAAGLGTLIGNLLTIGQDSPIEQLQKLADMGDQLGQAAAGVDKIGQAMKSFSGIDKKSLDAINDFPWLKATAFVAAGGAMSVSGAKVYNQSKGNADDQAQVNATAGKGASTNNVSTAVQNNTTNNQVIKLPSRNTESSYSAYSRSRYA